MEQNQQRVFTEEEMREMISALVGELPALRALAGISQQDAAAMIGVSRQTYGAIERKVREMSWSSYLSLILFFDCHNATHKLLRSLPAFPYEIFTRFNDGTNPGELDLNILTGLTDEDVISKLDEQALYTIRTVMMVEYARCTKLSSEAVVKSFDGRLYGGQTSDKDIRIRETLQKIKGACK